MLTKTMRFSGPIHDLTTTYRSAIKDINEGYVGNKFALNDATNREDKWDTSLNSGYKFKNSIYPLVEQISHEIKANSDDINYSRMLAFKNVVVQQLNNAIRDDIFGKNKEQFESGEIIISNGGLAYKNRQIIYNGELLRVVGSLPIIGPYEIPCLSLKFKNFTPPNNIVIPIVQQNSYATLAYNKVKNRLKEAAMRDRRQWVNYYIFIDSFAYFDYGYSVNAYKSQGQTLSNVYVLEGEIMGVKPLSLKQKYQALYVAMTRATSSLYIYNKEY